MWFTAKLIFSGYKEEGVCITEERLVVFRADDSEDAKDKALLYGKENEHTYKVEGNEELSWNFHKIEEIYEVGDTNSINDGMEVYSEFIQK